jgi:hypothetical protein
MDEPRPPFLYKYMTTHVAKLVLTNGTLKFSTPLQFNDPFDVQFDLHLEVDREKLRTLTVQKAWDAFYGDEYNPAPENTMGAVITKARRIIRKMSRDEFHGYWKNISDPSLTNLIATLPQHHAEIRSIMEKVKVLCLSAVGDSILMWSYYTENHKGVALRFKQVTGENGMCNLARSIEYSKTMPRLFDEDRLSDMLAGLANLSSEKIVGPLVYTKADQWKHEREWRLFIGYGNEPNQPVEYLPFGTDELDAVILGCAMTAEDREIIAALASKHFPGAKVVQTRKAEREFSLVVPD